MYKVIIVFLLCYTLLDAKLIDASSIDKEKYVLQLSTHREFKHVEQQLNQLIQEELYILHHLDLYQLYVVNLPTLHAAQKKQQELQYISKDSIIKFLPKRVPPRNQKSKQKSFEVILEYDIYVKERPQEHAKTIRRLHRGQTVHITILNNQWAKIVDKEEYFEQHLRPNLSTQNRYKNYEKFEAILESDILIKNAPNSNAKNLKMLRKGTNIHMMILNNEWCKIVGREEYFSKYTTQNTKSTNGAVSMGDFKKALALYQRKDYKHAYLAFEKLFDQNPKQKDINYYLARSATMIGELDIASAAYERLLIADPTLKRAQLELALIYFKQNKFDDAKKIFTEIKSQNPPKAVIQNIDKFLTAIESKRQKSFSKGAFIVGVSYENNIDNRSNRDTFYVPYFDKHFTHSQKKRDGVAHQETLIYNYIYKYSNNMLLNNDFVFFNKGYKRYHDKDNMLIYYNPKLSVVYDKLSVDYGIFASKFWNGKKRYIKNYGLFPKIKYMINDQTTLNAHLKYQKNRYLQEEDKERDGKTTELQLGSFHKLSQNLTLSPKITLSKERKNGGHLDSIDKNFYKAEINANQQVTKKLSFSPKISYKKTDYQDKSVFYFKKQKEKELKTSLGALYQSDFGWLIQGSYDYTNTQSNIDTSNYTTHSASINLIKPF
jgi:TolA-binding protein